MKMPGCVCARHISNYSSKCTTQEVTTRCVSSDTERRRTANCVNEGRVSKRDHRKSDIDELSVWTVVFLILQKLTSEASAAHAPFPSPSNKNEWTDEVVLTVSASFAVFGAVVLVLRCETPVDRRRSNHGCFLATVVLDDEVDVGPPALLVRVSAEGKASFKSATSWKPSSSSSVSVCPGGSAAGRCCPLLLLPGDQEGIVVAGPGREGGDQTGWLLGAL